MSDPTTQPVGALPDPEFLERASEALAAYMHANGVTDDTPVETDLPVLFALAVCVQNGANGIVASLMAGRDAAREELAGAYELLHKTEDEKSALRRELEELRAIPPDAREGREPLTEAQIEREFWTREFPCVDTSHRQTVLSLYVQRIFYIKGWKAALGIGPAGTSADGETQP